MAGSVSLGGQSINTGTDVVSQGIGTVESTGIAGYDGTEIPGTLQVDANNPARKVSPDGVTTTVPNIGQVPLSVSIAYEVRPDTPARQLLNVRNLSSISDIYLGTSDTLTTSNGYLLRPYEALDIRSTAPIWAIAASGTPSVCYYEEVCS